MADMTCPMDVGFHYVFSRRITGTLGSVRHPWMAALRPPLKRGCQEVVPQNNGTAAFAALYEGTRFPFDADRCFTITTITIVPCKILPLAYQAPDAEVSNLPFCLFHNE